MNNGARVEVIWTSFEVPMWLKVLILAALVAGAVVITLVVWLLTRRKGPPPLPRP